MSIKQNLSTLNSNIENLETYLQQIRESLINKGVKAELAEGAKLSEIPGLIDSIETDGGDEYFFKPGKKVKIKTVQDLNKKYQNFPVGHINEETGEGSGYFDLISYYDIEGRYNSTNGSPFKTTKLDSNNRYMEADFDINFTAKEIDLEIYTSSGRSVPFTLYVNNETMVITLPTVYDLWRLFSGFSLPNPIKDDYIDPVS